MFQKEAVSIQQFVDVHGNPEVPFSPDSFIASISKSAKMNKMIEAGRIFLHDPYTKLFQRNHGTEDDPQWSDYDLMYVKYPSKKDVVTILFWEKHSLALGLQFKKRRPKILHRSEINSDEKEIVKDLISFIHNYPIKSKFIFKIK